ncbi:heme exporter protein CcmD [Mesorhizobium sp. NBSH29]|uniref:heme exporter protein CcmD n=1 Tax=Mesorhizobium sp. NBSH29 TaxID=2654249 RepID=UPI0018968678|nr:heme exporter protein CcmD [Mesorhizobium sp. NBSH29]QPC86016.1 heme exporter protein CcmD [Mesorhizobium sp. NBSH29]
MSSHALYVAAAYGISSVGLAGLLFWILAGRRALRREVELLEASGIRRRSEPGQNSGETE